MCTMVRRSVIELRKTFFGSVRANMKSEVEANEVVVCPGWPSNQRA